MIRKPICYKPLREWIRDAEETYRRKPENNEPNVAYVPAGGFGSKTLQKNYASIFSQDSDEIVKVTENLCFSDSDDEDEVKENIGFSDSEDEAEVTENLGFSDTYEDNYKVRYGYEYKFFQVSYSGENIPSIVGPTGLFGCRRFRESQDGKIASKLLH